MISDKKKVSVKRKGKRSFWQTYSFVLTMAFILSLSFVFASAVSSSSSDYRENVSPYVSGIVYSDPNDITRAGTLQLYGAVRTSLSSSYTSTISTDAMASSVTQPSFSRSGSSFVASGSLNWSYSNSIGSYVSTVYQNLAVCVGTYTGVSSGSGAVYVNIPSVVYGSLSLPSDTSAYSLSGSIGVTYSISGTKSSTYHTSVPYAGVVNTFSPGVDSAIFEILLPAYSLDISDTTTGTSDGAKSAGNYTVSVTLDFSGLYIDFPEPLFLRDLVLPSGQWLQADGSVVFGSNVPAYDYLTQGFVGLHSDLTSGFSTNHDDLTSGFSVNHEDLTSGFSTNHDDLTSGFSTNHQDLSDLFRSLVGDYGSLNFNFDSPVASGGLNSSGYLRYSLSLWNSSTGQSTSVTRSNGLSGIVAFLGNSMQNDLAKLRYVLASDKDIEIAEKQAPVKDAVSDNFAGEGSAAVKDTDIGGMAGVSGDVKGQLDTGVDFGTGFGSLTSGDNFSFWSPETQAELNTSVQTYADDGYVDFSQYTLQQFYSIIGKED